MSRSQIMEKLFKKSNILYSMYHNGYITQRHNVQHAVDRFIKGFRKDLEKLLTKKPFQSQVKSHLVLTESTGKMLHHFDFIIPSVFSHFNGWIHPLLGTHDQFESSSIRIVDCLDIFAFRLFHTYLMGDIYILHGYTVVVVNRNTSCYVYTLCLSRKEE